ncbi:hypothetical protein K438DRAFT_1826222 [Mycena galopus ATCC 62051]|nr:hypothetical protein K438DRAFT_1826222 [Mycena galopus ATCC 62051]
MSLADSKASVCIDRLGILWKGGKEGCGFKRYPSCKLLNTNYVPSDSEMLQIRALLASPADELAASMLKSTRWKSPLIDSKSSAHHSRRSLWCSLMGSLPISSILSLTSSGRANLMHASYTENNVHYWIYFSLTRNVGEMLLFAIWATEARGQSYCGHYETETDLADFWPKGHFSDREIAIFGPQKATFLELPGASSNQRKQSNTLNRRKLRATNSGTRNIYRGSGAQRSRCARTTHRQPQRSHTEAKENWDF